MSGPKLRGRGNASYFQKYINKDGVTEIKECPTCHQDKKATAFYPDQTTEDGLSELCRSCHMKRVKADQSEEERERLKQASADATRRVNTGKTNKQRKRPFEGYTVHPDADLEGFLREVSEKVERLQEISQRRTITQQGASEKKRLIEEINVAVLLKGDGQPGGVHEDRKLAFLAFVEVIKPMIFDWLDFGEIHEDIINAILEPDVKRKQIICSRGSGKSSILRVYATWLLYRNPVSEQIVVQSQAEHKAREFIDKVKRYIALSPLLESIRPEADQTNNANRVYVRGAKLGTGYSLIAVGSEGQGATGYRGRVMIGDDIETEDTDTATKVDRLEEKVAELSRVTGSRSDAEIILLGTPWSRFSLYGRFDRRPDVWKTTKSCLFEKDEIDGKVVIHSRWPERYPDDELQADYRAEGHLESWRLGMELDLSGTDEDVQPIRLSYLPVLSLDPQASKCPIDLRPGGHRCLGVYSEATMDKTDGWYFAGYASEDETYWTETVALIDPAGATIGTNQDDMGLVIGSSAGPNVVVRFAKGVRGYSPEDILNRVAAEIQKYRCTKVIVEDSDRESWALRIQAALEARNYPMTVEAIRSGQVNKFKRIVNSIVPALSSSRVFVCKDVLLGEGGHTFTTQLCGVRENKRDVKLKKDDVVDAFARLMDHFSAFLAAPPGQYIAGARVNVEALKRLPPRMCALNEEEIEMFAEHSEDEIVLQDKLERLMETQRRELAQGLNDLSLAKLIEKMRKELDEHQSARIARISIPADRSHDDNSL